MVRLAVAIVLVALPCAVLIGDEKVRKASSLSGFFLATLASNPHMPSDSPLRRLVFIKRQRWPFGLLAIVAFAKRLYNAIKRASSTERKRGKQCKERAPPFGTPSTLRDRPEGDWPYFTHLLHASACNRRRSLDDWLPQLLSGLELGHPGSAGDSANIRPPFHSWRIRVSIPLQLYCLVER